MSKIEKNPYIRVGVHYYKSIIHPLNSGDTCVRLIQWSKEIIKMDEGNILNEIPKYDSFCMIPDHINYQRNIGTSYNRYEPFEHSLVQGNCQYILSFLNHIFGEQIDLGLDYFKLLFEKPTQVLPILCLVSSERNTGKTTFLNLLKGIFKGNMTINTNEDFRSNFNSDWASKLIIGVDEVLLERREDSERIKNLSTTKFYKAEAKGIDKIEIEFFGKFILCSNNEDTFIKIDPEETRYWVRKVPKLKNDDTFLLEKMLAEIPAFLFFLKNRDYSTVCSTRMWFTKEQIYTPALRKVMMGNQTTLEKELRVFLKELLDTHELDEISFTISDILPEVTKSLKCSRHQISETLRNRFELEPVKNPSTYKRYYLSKIDLDRPESGYVTVKGRYYTITSKHLEEVAYVDNICN